MPVILDRLPFFAHPTALTLGSEQVSIKGDQIVLWMSLTEDRDDHPGPRTPRFPVVLDIGLSHIFTIREEHLTDWAGLYPPLLGTRGHGRLSGRPANVLLAQGWSYRNQPGQRAVLLPQSPFPLEFEGGIAVYPRGTPDPPRLPTLGLRALRVAKLQLHIDGERCRLSLLSRRRWWIFG